MNTPLIAFTVAIFVIVGCAVAWSMFSGEVVGTLQVLRRSLFGRTAGARLTVRRVGSGSTPRARLQTWGGLGYRGIGLSRVNAKLCAEALERCAEAGRVTEDATGVTVGGVQVAPDFDGDEGRMVALVFPGDSDSGDVRLLLAPRQAKDAAAFLRRALQPHAK